MSPFGNFKLSSVSGGRFRIDGGTMFGVVPKALWARVLPPDENNNIPQDTNCLLVQTGTQNVLIDTGYGSKIPPKQRAIFAIEPGEPLVENLRTLGVAPEQIDVVILTHLHFDHAGGATRLDENGQLVDTFPNARYIVQKREWEIAVAQLPELVAAYPLENILPLENTGRLTFIDGDVEIIPGFRALVTGGHTAAHMSVVIASAGQTAVYLADICPSQHHLRSLWCMSYEVDLLQVRRYKPKILGQIADNGWLALFDHDPTHVAALLARDPHKEFVVTQAFETL